MKKPPKWLTVLGILIMGIIGAAGVSLGVYAAVLLHDLPDTSDLASYRPPTATRVFGWDGTLIGEYSTERRVYVPYDKIPAQVVNAFIAGEDKNFFRHGGVDFAGIGRASIKNIGNYVSGRRLEGGSTITQQVAKNILLTNESTLGRKLREAFIASRLEQQLSKEHILELYLNEIWLGYRSYGVGVAAFNYFGKSLDQLTLSEAAYLAALPKGPDNYHPIRRHQQAVERRNWILDQMVETGAITRAEAEAAKDVPLTVQDAPARSRIDYADFFVEEVRRQALERFGEDVNAGGYYIRTTLNGELQALARDSLMTGLESYDRRHGWRGAWGTGDPASNWREQVLEERPPSERSSWRAAIIESIDGSNVRVQPAPEGDAAGLLDSSDVTWARGGRGLNVGDLIFVEPAEEAGRYRLRQVPEVNGAMVVVNPHTGQVLAMVGGYSFSLSSFNRATQAERQPGSAFKPFVYATALENDFTPASVVVDGPMSLIGGDGRPWNPSNYSGDFMGPLVLRRGLELSRNTMTVRLAQQVGMRKVADDAARFGVVDSMDPVLSMALGAGETTPLRLTGAYSAFLNGGRRIDPHLIELVEDRDGRVIYRADPRNCQRCEGGFNGDEAPRLSPLGEQVMDPVTAYQISSMLQGVVQRGTAARASSLGRPLGGKTGTTNDYRSAWFVGFSPDMVVGVFVGFDDNRSLGYGETGSSAALPIFIDFMEDALADTPERDFIPPPEAKFAFVNGIREAFRPGAEPREDVIVSDFEYERVPQNNQPNIDLTRPQLPEFNVAPPPPAPPPQPKAPPPVETDVPDDLQGLY